MKGRDIVNDKGIEIIRQPQDKRIAISQEGIEIRRESKPISDETIRAGVVYLIVDCSGSMGEGNKLEQAKRGALNFAKEAKIKGYYIGLIQFHSYATHLCEPTREISVIEQHLKGIETGGTTHMAEAINLAYQKLKDKRGTRVMVVITDGMPNGPGDPEASLKAGERAKRDGIDIITIGTDDADQEFLKKLASRTELGVKVSRKEFEKGITSTVRMLPPIEPKKKGW